MLVKKISIFLLILLFSECIFAKNTNVSHSLNIHESYFIKASKLSKQIDYGKDRVIAILDTGINDDNIELKGQVIAEYDATSGQKKAIDKNGHGTRIASIIASKKDNVGIDGIAYNAKLIDVKVVEDDGSIKEENIIKGIEFAVKNGANTINMSFTSGGYSKKLESIINRYVNKVVFVASAGNEGENSLAYPAAYKNVVAVSSYENGTQKRAIYANYDDTVYAYIQDDIWTYDGKKYKKEIGTSEAAAVVSSYIKSYNPKTINTKSKNKSKKLANSDTTSGLDVFQDSEAKSFLNSYIRYLMAKKEVGHYTTTIRQKMKYESLLSYSHALSSITVDKLKKVELLGKINSLIILYDMFASYSKQVYVNEYENFEYDKSTLAKLLKYVADLKNALEGIGDTVKAAKGITALLQSALGNVKGKTSYFAKMTRKISRVVMGDVFDVSINSYKVDSISKLNKNNVQKTLKYLRYTEVALKTLNKIVENYADTEKQLAFFSVNVADFLTQTLLLEDSAKGTPLSKTFFKIIKDSVDDTSGDKLESLMRYMTIVGYARVFTPNNGFTQSQDKDKKALGYKVLENIADVADYFAIDGVKSLFTGLLDHVIKASFDEVSNAVMYSLYAEFISGIDIGNGANTGGYITSSDILRSMVTSVAHRNYLYYSTVYAFAIMRNQGSWENAINYHELPALENLELTPNGSKIHWENEFDIFKYSFVGGKQMLYAPFIDAKNKIQDGIGAIKNFFKKESLNENPKSYINTYLNAFKDSNDGNYLHSIATFSSTSNSILKAYAKYQTAVLQMLESKETYNAVASNNKKLDMYLSNAIGTFVLKNTIIKTKELSKQLDFLIPRSLLFEVNNGISIITKEYLNKMNDNVTRKDFMIALLKGAGLNPYNNEIFLKELYKTSNDDTNSDSMTKYFSDINTNKLTMNEKIWLLYGKYQKVDSDGNFRIITGYNDGTLKPFNYISREEAIALVGAIVKSLNKGKSYTYESAISKMNSLGIPESELNAISNESFKKNIGKAVLDDLVHGKPIECKDNERTLDLQTRLSYFETGVITFNLYNKLKPIIFPIIASGNQLDKADSPNCPEPIDMKESSIQSVKTVHENQVETLTYHSGYDGSNLEYINITWEAPIGEITDFKKGVDSAGKIYTSIKYTAPKSNMGEYLLPITISFINNSGKGSVKKEYVKVLPEGESSNTDSVYDDSDSKVQLQTSYSKNTNKFDVSWKAISSGRLEVKYSFDKTNWTRYGLVTVGNYQGNSISKVINGTDVYNTIYFKTILTVGSQKYYSGIKTLNYETKSDTYVEKETEPPSTPSLASVRDTTTNSSVKLLWKRVNDSESNDNVVKYEVMYADNSSFNNATTLNASNNAAHQHKNEYCSYTVTGLEDDTKYYFKVRAYNNYNGGTYSRWSNKESTEIEIEDLPYFDTSYQAPQNGATNVSKMPTLRWSAMDDDGDELQYYVKIGTDPSLSTTLKSFNHDYSQEFSFISNDEKMLKPNTTYYWQVLVRERGHFLDYYDNGYIASPVWSFTTNSSGPDLVINKITQVNEMVIGEWVTFNVEIENVGNEKSDKIDVMPYFIKNGVKNKFYSYRRGYMSKKLQPGEKTTVKVELRFSNSIEERFGESFDNIIMQGNNTIRFSFDYDEFDVDTSSSNNDKEFNIVYDVGSNLPKIKNFGFIKNNLSERKGDYRYMLGWPVTYWILAEDDLSIKKVELEYRVNDDSNWVLFKTFSNINNSDFKVGHGGDTVPWILPNDKKLLSQNMRLRVKVYNSDTTYSVAISPEIKVFENDIGVDEIILDKSSYKQGEEAMLNYNFHSRYDIEDVVIKIRNGEYYAKTIFKYNKGENGPFVNFADSVRFNTPSGNSERWANGNNYIEIFIRDINGAGKKVNSKKFTLVQNVDMPQPFSQLKNIYSQAYPYPSSAASNKSTDNHTVATYYDGNTIHMIVRQNASWIDSHHDFFGHNSYKYITYNLETNAISYPIDLFSEGVRESGATRYAKSLYVKNGKPYAILYNDKDLYLYRLEGNSFVEKKIDSSYNLVHIGFFERNDSLFYLYKEYQGSNRIAKVVKIDTNLNSVGPAYDFFDSSIAWSLNVFNGNAYLGDTGEYYTLNENGQIQKNTKRELEVQNYKMLYTGGIYDKSIKNFGIDNNLMFYIIDKNDNRINAFKIDNSDAIGTSTSTHIDLAMGIFEDKIFVMYELDIQGGMYYKLLEYDKNSKKSKQIVLKSSTKIGDLRNFSLFNKNKKMFIPNINANDSIVQITVADLSKGLNSIPSIKLTSSSSVIKIGKSVNINWSKPNSENFNRIEIFKTVGNQNYLLDTIYSTDETSYTYTQENTSDLYVNLKAMIYNDDGKNSSYTTSFRILGNPQLSNLAASKSSLDLHEAVKFTWSSSGANSNNLYEGYRKCENESTWSKIFTTKETYKNFVVDNFVGNCYIKIKSEDSEVATENTIQIKGNLMQFNNNVLTQEIHRTTDSDNVVFNWDIWSSKMVNFSLQVKNASDSSFTTIAQTATKSYIWKTNLAEDFKWKVSFDYDGNHYESDVQNVSLLDVSLAQISSADFAIVDNTPQTKLTFLNAGNGAKYIVYRASGNDFINIATTSETTYTDTNIAYGQTYRYYVVVNKDENYYSSPIINVESEHMQDYDITILNSNNLTLDSNNIILTYKPSVDSQNNAYEILLGTDPDNLLQYTITNKKSLDISGLDYATMYFVEIYPVDYSGVRISTVPAKLTFTTGFDKRTIDGKIDIKYNEVATDYISLTWNKLENVDVYRICRSESSGAYDCFATTSKNYFIDNVNIIPGNSYTYIVKAENSNSVKASNPTYKVYISNPNEDRDGDGILDGNDQNLNDGPNADPDGDGKVNSVDFDDDNDGMLDTCESKYPDYLNQWADDADMDADSDGYTNLQECQGGSDPTDDTSYPSGTTSNMVPILMYLLDSGGSTSSSNKDTTQIPIIMYLLN